MGLARAIAARYRGRGIADDDLTQAASMALLKAARNFDADRGVEFLSYAVVTMKGEVKRQFRDFGWMVRPPRPIQKLQADVSRAEGELTHRLGRSPKVSEVAAHLGVPEEDVVEALSADGCFTPTSLDTPVGADGSGVLGELLPGDDSGDERGRGPDHAGPRRPRPARARARDPLPPVLQAADPGADRRGDRRHPDAGLPDPGAGAGPAARPARLTGPFAHPLRGYVQGLRSRGSLIMPSWVIWVIVAIVVIAVIAAVVAASNKKKQERNRTRAAELREQAAAQATGVQQREAHAKETEAQAAAARAEADRKQAEAERLAGRGTGPPEDRRGATASSTPSTCVGPTSSTPTWTPGATTTPAPRRRVTSRGRGRPRFATSRRDRPSTPASTGRVDGPSTRRRDRPRSRTPTAAPRP